MSREVMKLALEVLKGCLEHPDAQDSIIAIEHELAQPEQEPVASMEVKTSKAQISYSYSPEHGGFALPDGTYKLYTSPPQRQPLTDKEIDEIVDAHTTDDGQGYDIWCDGRGVARAIEAKHGIGDKT